MSYTYRPRFGLLLVEKRKVKFIARVKVKTIHLIAPLSVETSPQGRPGIARVVEGVHSFTCTPTCLSTNGMNHTCLRLASRSWSSFTGPGGMEDWNGLGTTTASKQSAQDRYVTAITVVSCSCRHASLGNWSTGERRTHDHSGCKPRPNHRTTESSACDCDSLVSYNNNNNNGHNTSTWQTRRHTDSHVITANAAPKQCASGGKNPQFFLWNSVAIFLSFSPIFVSILVLTAHFYGKN